MLNEKVTRITCHHGSFINISPTILILSHSSSYSNFYVLVVIFNFIYSLLSLTLSLMELGYMQEVGHFLVAFPKKVKLSIPFCIPNITLGSFGAITQVNISNYLGQTLR